MDKVRITVVASIDDQTLYREVFYVNESTLYQETDFLLRGLKDVHPHIKFADMTAYRAPQH